MKVKFLPQNVSVDIKPGKNVMELARENKLPISSSCNGMCSCAECRVYIVEGEAHILPPSAKEVELIGGGYFIDNRRLSCQLFCFGDVTVDLSEQVDRGKQAVKKQFLKHLSKGGVEESSSVGGILVEQDQEINKISVSEEENTDLFPSDGFYEKKAPGRNKNNKNRQNKKDVRQTAGRSSEFHTISARGNKQKKRRNRNKKANFKYRRK